MPVPLPRDERLPDEAVVVRAGLLANFDDVREAAAEYYRNTETLLTVGIYGISVLSLPGLTSEEILCGLPEHRRPPNKKYRETTVAALRGVGYDVVPSGWIGHATLQFPVLPTEKDWVEIQRVFGPERRNPARRTT